MDTIIVNREMSKNELLIERELFNLECQTKLYMTMSYCVNEEIKNQNIESLITLPIDTKSIKDLVGLLFTTKLLLEMSRSEIVLELILSNTYKNISASTYKKYKKLNKKNKVLNHFKKFRLPHLIKQVEEHTNFLKSQIESSQEPINDKNYKGGWENSPHIRRGHYRTYKNGRTIWVEEMNVKGGY